MEILHDLLDIVVACMLSRLLGWHWAFLPSIAAKVVRGIDLVPTWTMAVLVATREAPRQQPKSEPPIIEGLLKDDSFQQHARQRSADGEVTSSGRSHSYNSAQHATFVRICHWLAL
jgi:hypothetical protein